MQKRGRRPPVKTRRKDKKKVSRLQVREGMNKGFSASEWNLPEKKKLKKILVKPKSKKTKKAKKNSKTLADKRKAYNKYINSKIWKAFKKSIIEERGEFCEDCGIATNKLHLHHLNYGNFGNELSTDVQLLCVPCHEKPEKHPWRK